MPRENLVHDISHENTNQGADNTIGKLLIDAGKIQIHDVEKIIHFQQDEGLRFGEAALSLGLIDAEDLRHTLAKQYDYAYLSDDSEQFSKELIAGYSPFSPEAEVFRAVRSHLSLRWFNREHRAISIVSAGAGDGRSYFIANLGVVFSQFGERTLIIDADLRGSRQHQIFNTQNETGLSSVLAGRVEDAVIEELSTFPNLCVLPAGPEPPNPQELLGRKKFVSLLDKLAKEFDVILIDTPAMELCSDAKIVASRSRGAVVMAKKGHTRVATIRDFVKDLAGMDVEVAGSVLNTY